MAGISEEAVNEVARNLFDGGDIDYTIERDGSANIDTWNLPDVDNYEYSYGTVAKETLDKAIELLTKLISSVKFYVGDNGASLELNDNHTLWDINAPDEYEGEFDYDYYQYLVDQALDDFEERTGVEAHQDGRMGRHIVVDITFDNMTRFDELKAIQEELEADVIEKAEAECFPVVDDMTESLNKGEKKARCLSCGADVIYTNRDVCHDIDGDYIECPNCNATFDVDYDAIEPLLNKKTEAEDMTQVKDDVKSAVEKSDSTKQEKDQVKGSIDVLKTDEESAIDGYKEFNKETAKVVDKELADTIDDQMQEIVDDEKEHIEKLDIIKSALGESKKEEEYDYWKDNNEYTYFIVKDGTPTMHEVYNVINRKDNTITEIKDGEKRDTTAHCKELYNKDKRQNFMNKNGNYLGTDMYKCLLDGKYKVPAGDEVILYTNNEEEFNDKLNEILNNKSTLGESKKEELFNNSINLNVDAGDIASGNNLDLGGLGAIAGLMASEETKESDDKLEEATSGDVIRENLNTGVLRIIDVDMYSINDEIPESATQEGLDEIVQDIAPKYIKEVIQEVLPSVEIYATGVYHPKQYNFSGDELEFDLVANKEEYEALKEKVTSNEDFNAFLRNNYKSYDGFISYMADDISEFKTQDTWKQVVQVIMFAIQDEDNFGAIRNEYLDEFLDRVHTEFGWDDEDDDLEENKKEELFDNTADINVNANDIGSNNNLDLGGLGDLLGMTEAKALEAKNNLPKTEDEWVEIEAKRQWKDNQEAEFGKWENQSAKVKNDYKKEIANSTQNERQEYFENKGVNA